MQAHLKNSKSSLTNLANEKECHVIKNFYNNDDQSNNNNEQNDEKLKFQFIEYSDSPLYSKPIKIDTDIDYKSLKKKRENDDKSVIVNSRAENEEIWPILLNNSNTSRRCLKNSTNCEVLTEEKVSVV
jgi:hypothetical protein